MTQSVYVEIGNVTIQQVGSMFYVDFAGEYSMMFYEFKSALEEAWNYFNTPKEAQQ